MPHPRKCLFYSHQLKEWPTEKSAVSAKCFASGFGGKSGFVSMVRLILKRYTMGMRSGKLRS